MSINFRIYNSFGSTTPATMKSSDLEVGQKLVRLVEGSYDTSLHSKLECTVIKVLKTRLVISDSRGRELRIVVKNDSWNPNEVTDTLEGSSNSYHRTSVKLATMEDESYIDAIIATRADAVAKKNTLSAAQNAARAVSQVRYPELADVEAAIAALQALAEQMKAEAR